MEKSLQTVIENVHRLAATDPVGDGVSNSVKTLFDSVNSLKAEVPAQTDSSSVIEQIDLMRSLVASSMNKHEKMMNILNGVRKAAELLQLPVNESMRPRVASVVQKIAGIFAEVDTVADLEGKSLEQIEKAVGSLYGNNQSLNKNFYFTRAGRGHGPKFDE